jgi:hypothetical protein
MLIIVTNSSIMILFVILICTAVVSAYYPGGKSVYTTTQLREDWLSFSASLQQMPFKIFVLNSSRLWSLWKMRVFQRSWLYSGWLLLRHLLDGKIISWHTSSIMHIGHFWKMFLFSFLFQTPCTTQHVGLNILWQGALYPPVQLGRWLVREICCTVLPHSFTTATSWKKS